MTDLLLRTLRQIDQRAIRYCVLRGGDDLARQVEEGEVDLLVARRQVRQLRHVLARLGFAHERTWGHGPHHFFLAYDRQRDGWLKLDVVTGISYGRPLHVWSTALGPSCLGRRRRWGAVFVPAPEDEFVTLLLHCVIDRQDFPEIWRHRLVRLLGQITDKPGVSQLLSRYWDGRATFDDIEDRIVAGRWETLVRQRQDVLRRLAAGQRGRACLRGVRDGLLRKANRIAHWIAPRPLAVALLAPDGAGKSTLAANIAERFYFPVRRIYMGLYPKDGPVRPAAQLPGWGLLRNLTVQWLRCLAGRYHRSRGRFVLFDRYAYDALLPPPRPKGPMSRLRRWILGHACPPPDLVVLLDAPGELLHGRKQEYHADRLEQQRRAYLALGQCLTRAIVVDARHDAQTVRRTVTAAIWAHYARRTTLRAASPLTVYRESSFTAEGT